MASEKFSETMRGGEFWPPRAIRREFLVSFLSPDSPGFSDGDNIIVHVIELKFSTEII